MTREELQDKSLVELIELAKNNGIKSAARKRKAELIELLQSNTEIDLNNSKEIHANEDAAMMGTPLMETNQEEAFDAPAPEQEQVNQAPSFRPISEPKQREERPRSEYGEMVVFDELFWLQSTKILPARRDFFIVDTTRSE